jgi:glycosyltransferase involved in cell wall biosynthesis
MKILVLSPKPPWPPHDGGAVATMRCIEGLAACGASVTLLTMRTEKHHKGNAANDRLPVVIRKYESVSVDTRIRPLKILANLLFSGEPYDLLRFRSQEYSDAVHSLINEEEFDLIHCEGLLFSLYVDDIRRQTVAPIILRAHNVEHRIRAMMADAEKNIFRRIYLRNLAARIKKLELQACQKFDAIIPISEPDYQWFKTVATAKHVMLCETGINVNIADTETDTDTGDGVLRVGFIGALNWQPNLEGLRWFLAEVWPVVSERIPEAHIHIAGRGTPTGNGKWLHGRNVMFEGEVDDSGKFISRMTVMIAPLFAGSGLRIKIIEAMSHGKPVIATPIAANGLPVNDGYEIFISNDAKTFADRLILLLSNTHLRKTSGNAARELARTRFDNRKQTTALYDFYKRLCDGC